MTRLSIMSILALVLGGAALAGCKSAGMGAETRADITAQMKLAEEPIQACYAEVLKTNRRVKGRLSVQLVAEANTGQFKNINVLRDEPKHPELTRCVVAEIGKLKLSQPTKAQVQINQPILLMPNN
jgi:hypothetical protein